MKIIKYLFTCVLMASVVVSCERGLDPIDAVNPGPDTENPALTITYPVVGKQVRVPEEFDTVIFKLTATDDIELKSVVLKLDGTEIANITNFKDYRRLVLQFPYDSIPDGDHNFAVVVTDMSDKSVSQTMDFVKITAPGYEPLDQEVLYFPFEDSYIDLVGGNEATVVGAPGFTEGKVGQAYAGATDAYITYPTDGIVGDEFSVAFWYKLNPDPGRAGIIAICRPYEVYNDSTRFKGLRVLREPSGTKMNFGLNFGIGAAEVWMNPFKTIDITDEWIHFAITISPTTATIYLNGEVAMEKTDVEAPLDWTDCTSISIASGMPNFTYWDHNSDLSLYDEMHFFKRAITAEEVQALFNVKK